MSVYFVVEKREGGLGGVYTHVLKQYTREDNALHLH